MKVLFCHNGPLGKDADNRYYGVAHNDRTFQRYYNIADELQVLIRTYDIDANKKSKTLSEITVKPFEVISVPNFLTATGVIKNRGKAHKIIEEAVKNADFVVARVPSSISEYAITVAKKLNKPYLVEVVACPWDALWNHSLLGKLCAPFMWYSTRKCVRDAKYALYVTHEFLQNRYPTSGKTVSCSNVSLDAVSEELLKSRISKIDNESDVIKLGTTAAINVRFKGQQYIIQALGKLKKQGITKFRYEIVGGGDPSFLQSQIKKYDVADLVTIKGSLPHAEVFEWLDTIDVYVQPSRQEGLPRALIEAMSRGLPAFGAKTGGIPELLEKQFIFSNTNRNIKEICKILSLFDTKTMREQAERNFNAAKDYQKDILENRRSQFFKNFREENVK